jgi:hypothetical protein
MHGISLTFAKPTIVLRGAASTASFTVTGIDGKTATSPVLALDVTKAVRTVKGRTVTLTGIPATVAPTAGALFNGMYPAGAPFGSLTVRYTVAK